MKKKAWFRFVFTDGFATIAKGLSAREQSGIEDKHGKLLYKQVEASL